MDATVVQCDGGHPVEIPSMQWIISGWAEKTFGRSNSNVSIAARALAEMSELVTKLANDDTHPDAAEEIADVVIVLMRLSTRLGSCMAGAIDKKMRINFDRKWELDGNGHGQHVSEETKAS